LITNIIESLEVLMATNERPERPPKVTLAVKMFYLICGIGAVRTTLTVLRHIDVRSPDTLIVTKLLIYATSILLIYQTGKGKNWARWAMVVIFVGCLPIEILPLFEELSHNPVNAFLGCVSLGLYLVGLVFLFLKESSAWFVGGLDSGNRGEQCQH
jgi:hypothetical protein